MSSPDPQPRPFRFVRWVPLSALVIGVAAALVLAAAPWSTAVTSVGGAPLVTYRGPVPSFGAPAGYHIVYRVTTPASPVYTDDLWVERPYQSVDRSLAGAPPGGAADLTTVARLGAQVVKAGTANQASLIYVPAAVASEDVRLDAVIGPALRARDLLIVGRARILGRSCVVIRSAAPLRSAGPLGALRAGSSYVDSCVDGQGLVLEETTYHLGRLTERRQAVSVRVGANAAAGGDYQLEGEAVGFYQGGGSFTPLTLTSSPPGLSWVASSLPAGFRHAGRFAVVPSQPQAFDNTTGAPPPGPATLGLPGSLVTELDDAYVRGPDLIVVQQGVTMGGGKFNPPSGGQQVDLGILGEGQLTLTTGASVITAEPDNRSHFVRLSGTVAPDVLLAMARSLSVEAPGKLVRLP